MTVPYLFVYRVRSIHCHLFLGTWRWKSISGTLFVVSWSLNIFFLPFCCIWTCKYIKDSYRLAVGTLNTPSTPYLFVDNCWKRDIYPFMLWFGLQNINRTFVVYWKVLSMVVATSFVVCLLLNCLFVLFWYILSCNCISGAYLVAVSPLNRLETSCMLVYNCWQPVCCFFSCHLEFKNVKQMLVWAWKHVNTWARSTFCISSSKNITPTSFVAF